MANFTKTYNAEDPNDYSFDSDLIEYTSGQNPKLKDTPLFSQSLAYYRFLSTPDVLTDYSGSRNLSVAQGSAPVVSSAVTIGGETQTIATNGGNGNYLNLPSNLYASQIFEHSVSFNILVASSSNESLITFNGLNGMGFTIQNQSSVFSYGVYSDSSSYRNTTSALPSDGWHHVAMTAKFTPNGGNYDLVIKMYYDGVLQKETTFNAIGAPSFWGGGTRDNALFSLAGGGGSEFSSAISNFYVTDNELTQSQISEIFSNNGNIFQYSKSSPTLRQNTSNTDSQLTSYGGYSLTDSGDGSVGLRLSKDNYLTTEYWNSLTNLWDSTGSSYNTVSTVNTNIDDFSAVEQDISTEIALISDGFQLVELLVEQINYAVNTAPTVNSGFDKPLGGQAAITQTSNFKPSSDGTATDVEGPITKIEVSPNGGAFAEINIGPYASLVEAWNNDQYNASIFGVGTIPFITRVTDSFGATSQDTVQVTIVNDNTATIEDTNTKVTQLLADLATTDSKVEDIHDCHLGSERAITVGGVQTIKRKDTTTLATYNTYDETNTQTNEDITKVVKQ